MNAKELIEAAIRVNEEWNVNRISSEDLQAVINHVMDTVRTDDDEPVNELACTDFLGTPRVNDWGDACWVFGVRGPSLTIGCLCGTVTLVWGRHPIDLPDDLTMSRLRDILRGFGLTTNK